MAIVETIELVGMRIVEAINDQNVANLLGMRNES